MLVQSGICLFSSLRKLLSSSHSPATIFRNLNMFLWQVSKAVALLKISRLYLHFGLGCYRHCRRKGKLSELKWKKVNCYPNSTFRCISPCLEWRWMWRGAGKTTGDRQPRQPLIYTLQSKSSDLGFLIPWSPKLSRGEVVFLFFRFILIFRSGYLNWVTV